MPIYEYVADHCAQQPPCSRRKAYLERLNEPARTACVECQAPIQRVFSTFAARSGSVGTSTPDPTPLNTSGLPAPASDPAAFSSEEGGCGHSHD